MKKIFFILAVVLPALLVAQLDSSHQTSKKGNCNPVLAASHHDKDTCTLSVLIKYPFITVPCGKVIYYRVSLAVGGIFVDKQVSGNYIPEDVSDLLKSDKYDCYIVIKDIHFRVDDGSIKTARGMLIHILKK